MLNPHIIDKLYDLPRRHRLLFHGMCLFCKWTYSSEKLLSVICQRSHLHFVSSLNERGTLHIWITKSKCPWYLQVSLNCRKLISHCNFVFCGHSSFWYWNMLNYESTQQKINLATNFSSLDLFENDFFSTWYQTCIVNYISNKEYHFFESFKLLDTNPKDLN